MLNNCRERSLITSNVVSRLEYLSLRQCLQSLGFVFVTVSPSSLTWPQTIVPYHDVGLTYHALPWSLPQNMCI